ncbi:MAG: hypothetical protein H6733_11985 [Alphaproteobacteria bacterium]|nr:hypothetical protein [Alphaproteobacteria bacterium]
MTTLPVEQVFLQFEPSVDAFQYEKGGVCVAGWPAGKKVVDVVANEVPSPPAVAWLIEVKDFRIITNPPRPSNLSGLAETVEAKVRQTLASLPVVASNSPDPVAVAHATHAILARSQRVVLHLEPHPASGTHAALFPVGYAANVLLKLRSLVADIDPNPLVIDIARTANAPVPWSAK